MEREVRRDLTEAAEKHAVDVFARNLRSLLLQPPIPKQVVLAIDPGLRSGCKLAVLDPNGNLLDQAVVYPHAPQGRRSEAKLFIKDLVGKHQVGVVAIGNGTACRETEELVAEIIAEGIEFSQNPEARAAAEAAAQTAAAEAEARGRGPRSRRSRGRGQRRSRSRARGRGPRSRGAAAEAPVATDVRRGTGASHPRPLPRPAAPSEGEPAAEPRVEARGGR